MIKKTIFLVGLIVVLLGVMRFGKRIKRIMNKPCAKVCKVIYK